MLPRTNALSANGSPPTCRACARASNSLGRELFRRCPLLLLLATSFPYSAGAWTQTQFVLGTFWEPCKECYYLSSSSCDPNYFTCTPEGRARDSTRYVYIK